MVECKHEQLEFVGLEKTDAGQNKYMTCKTCGSLIVVTAAGKVISVKGIDSQSPWLDQTDT